jgi:type I restriction enzyme S subunit
MEVLQGKTVQKERGLPKGWKEVKLNQVAEIDKESLPGNTNKSYEFDYISLSDVDSNSLRIETSKQVFENAPSRARRIVRKGDVLMSTVRPNLQGFTIIRNEVINLIASTGFAVIRPKSIISEFLFQYLFSGIISKQFYSLLVGSNYPAINSSDVKNLKILLPPLHEQQAIADCLSTWDGAIQAAKQLIRQKELQKKWLMQQLLTGKKRLKGFSGEWREIHIRDIAKEVSLRNKNDNELIVLSCTKYDGLVSSLEYFGRKVFSDDLRNYKIVPLNHFAYATNHIEEGSIGFQQNHEKALISPMYTVFKTDRSVNDGFFFRLLKSHSMIYQYQNRMEGSIDRRGGLRWSAFSIIRVKIPTYEEQTAINIILSESDRELDLLRNRLEKIREQKKGLMQVLLTGKRRLMIKEL